MKPKVSWSCLLLAFSVGLILINASNAAGRVLDVDGDEIRRGETYYIAVVLDQYPDNRFRGIIPAVNGCPYQIMQQYDVHFTGAPVRFFPANASNDVIVNDSDINIKFDCLPSPSPCPESNVWMVNCPYKNASSRSSLNVGECFITTGGVGGKPGPETLPNWFQIHQYEDAYSLQHCPSASFCRNVGIYMENGGRRLLALMQEPVKVAFLKGKRLAELAATN